MTRDSIITQLFHSREFNDCINKMDPEHLRDDLKSEVMLVLCEKEDAFITSMYQKGQLRFWVIRVVLNMVQSKTSAFYKTFRQQVYEYNGDTNGAMDYIQAGEQPAEC